jgi:hypothetical protein
LVLFGKDAKDHGLTPLSPLSPRFRPLNVGGVGGSTGDWLQYFAQNPGAQRKAFDAVLKTARAIDAKYGTSITRDIWTNIVEGRFTPGS